MKQLIVKEYIPYAQSVNINEHRAPTDDSIRLYNDILEKTQDSVLHAVKIDDNILKAVYVVFSRGGMFDSTIIKAYFTLNSISYSFELDMNNYTMAKHDDVVQLLYGKMSQLIAQQLVREYVNICKNNLI